MFQATELHIFSRKKDVNRIGYFRLFAAMIQ